MTLTKTQCTEDQEGWPHPHVQLPCAHLDLTQADPEDIPSRMPLDFILEDVPIDPGTSVLVRQTGEFFNIEPDTDPLVLY